MHLISQIYIKVFLCFITVFCAQLQCYSQHQLIYQEVKGVSYRGPCLESSESLRIQDIRDLGASWIAIIPQSLVDRETLKIEDDDQKYCWSQRNLGAIASILEAKKLGFRVLLKPHIVLDKTQGVEDRIKKATWRGEIECSTSTDWRILERNYSEYILEYARIANSMEVEMFCIGTELKKFATKRNAYWKQLISEVRSVYSGAICYSANWDEYSDIQFWNDVDYIGMNSYFPISEERIPEVNGIISSWKKILEKIKKFAEQENKKVLITEMGYRNVLYAGREPWLHNKGLDRRCDQAQVNLYKAFLNSIKTQKWIIGFFQWEWNHIPYEPDNTDFSIQNKPAYSVLKNHFMLL